MATAIVAIAAIERDVMRSIRVELRVKPEWREQLIATLIAEASEVPRRFDGCERYAVFVHPQDACSRPALPGVVGLRGFRCVRRLRLLRAVRRSVFFPMVDGPPDSAYFDSVHVGP